MHNSPTTIVLNHLRIDIISVLLLPTNFNTTFPAEVLLRLSLVLVPKLNFNSSLHNENRNSLAKPASMSQKQKYSQCFGCKSQ